MEVELLIHWGCYSPDYDTPRLQVVQDVAARLRAMRKTNYLTAPSFLITKAFEYPVYVLENWQSSRRNYP